MKFSGVYVIENLKNNKRYIGSSNSIYNRVHKHQSLLNHNKHENSYLQNAWNKYGTDCFSTYVIEYCTEDLLTAVEQKWIDFLNPEYNITLLAERNILSESSRKQISETLLRRYADGTILPTRTRKIFVYDLDGKFISEYNSLSETSRKLKVARSSIDRVLAGKYRQVKGYQFRYENDSRKITSVTRGKYLKRFIPAPEKPSELLETPEKDNQQPS